MCYSYTVFQYFINRFAKYQNPEDPSGVIQNWMSNKDSFAFYSLLKELNNDDFKIVNLQPLKIWKVYNLIFGINN